MTTSIDGPPIYDFLTQDKNHVNQDYMSDIWRDYQSTLYQTLVSYFSAYGFFIPNKTQKEIEGIQAPVVGQTLFNTTIDCPQIYTSMGWKVFMIV